MASYFINKKFKKIEIIKKFKLDNKLTPSIKLNPFIKTNMQNVTKIILNTS